MFVAVKNDETGEISRFSYGPEKGNLFSPGKLVSHSEMGTKTDNDDRSAMESFFEDSVAASQEGIVAAKIDASDADVIASGEAVNSVLGTTENPSSDGPRYNFETDDPSTSKTTGLPIPGTANSNSAGYAVGDRSNPNVTQSVPAGTNNPGVNQHNVVPRTGSHIRKREWQ